MTETGSAGQRTRAWVVECPGPIRSSPLRRVERVLDPPGPRELLVEVGACGVCRTDLHLAEGDLPPHRAACTPGHEIVGRVLAAGLEVRDFAPGDRVGAAWLASTCGTCRYCRASHENLCPYSRYTGWDIHGGYAGHTLVDAGYAYPLPEGPPDEELAPLLCAGIIGYRALERAQVPPGGRLGIYGYGASGHLTAQLALSRGATVHVLTRAEDARRLALELGAASARGAYDTPPEPLDAAVLFAPVGELVPVALAALERGGTLAVAGIHLTDIPALNYQQHLFQERSLRSVTANTREDGLAYLAEAARHHPTVHVQRYPMNHADTALGDLAAGRITGAAVLMAR
ncbi:zinc-binding alcohol dehydrogenase family protein [Streptomyces tateyamensis]|uniref:Probable alcohol dehydrogenase AdhA n=1 Tax=Streptomyces tateyamensis TaxID=565073 RepID=A0A2V4P9F4_9ACTN|nr:zinc-binding alcohol dehydrogenase family protein [Streptomyces tateyamensis]PYC87328.1 zinc-binding alcohol dehydrogenase family protein [Streptomyces tateyamensis]